MATCDTQELMDQAGCFACLSEADKATAALVLLCRILNAEPVDNPLEASFTTSNETVVDGVPQADGQIAVAFSGSVDPYYVQLEGVDPFPIETVSPYDLSALAGGDYTIWVYDEEGRFNGFVETPHSIRLQVHVFRDAFNWSVSFNGSRGSTAFPGAPASLSIGPASPVPRFSPVTHAGFASAVLTNVNFNLASGALRNDWSIQNADAPTSRFFSISTFTDAAVVAESVTRVTGTITRPTRTGDQTLFSQNYAGPASTSIAPASVNFADPATLAACAGAGNLDLLYTSTRPLPDLTGSDAGITGSVNSITYSFLITVTYSYHVPEE
jgi:hypothetical protein